MTAFRQDMAINEGDGWGVAMRYCASVNRSVSVLWYNAATRQVERLTYNVDAMGHWTHRS